jgi:hypothetical protein
MSAIEWHGEKAYARCDRCRKLVQVNKKVFGSTHLCKSDCELAGRHLGLQTRRVGPFWNRKTEPYCSVCRLAGERRK